MKRHGTTLVELLVTMSVLAVVGFLMVTMYFTTERVRQGESLGSFVQTENIFGQQRIRDALSDGASIAQTVTIDGTVYTTGPQTLVFRVPSVNASGDSIANTWDTSVITLEGIAPAARIILLVQPDAASSRPRATTNLASSIDDLRIRYESISSNTSTKVNVTIRTLKTVGSNSRRFTTDTATILRNS